MDLPPPPGPITNNTVGSAVVELVWLTLIVVDFANTGPRGKDGVLIVGAHNILLILYDTNNRTVYRHAYYQA